MCNKLGFKQCIVHMHGGHLTFNGVYTEEEVERRYTTLPRQRFCCAT